MKHINFVVSEEDVNLKKRIDTYICDKCLDFSRSYVQKLIKEKFVYVNDSLVKANYVVKVGDVIDVSIEEPKLMEVVPEDIELAVVYEDSDILIVNKPKGMVVHPAPGNFSGTLVNALLHSYGNTLPDINGVLRPGIVHRIDKDTEGIIVIAKNINSHRFLTEQFKEHSITRKYHAIVCGDIKDDSGTINVPIGRDVRDRKKMAVTEKNSKSAITHYKVLERFKKYTYIECTLDTGRTHQIRVHMSYMKHPLLGDFVYGSKKNEFNIEGQVLFAKVLGFIHPSTKKYVEFDVNLSDGFVDILSKLRNKYGGA